MPGSQFNSSSDSYQKLPILIVAYTRADLLKKMLEALQETDRRVYVAIDKAPLRLKSENERVITCATNFLGRMNLTMRVNDRQAGVKLGVPTGIDWIFEFEDVCIIFEDDCLISAQSLEYFDKFSRWLKDDIAVISGDSPWTLEQAENTTSSFPLIWGWATNRTQWEQVNELIGGQIPVIRILKFLLKHPSKIVPLSFFLAAQIRVKREILAAWDCSLALQMLLLGKKSLIPNIQLVENVGYDEHAHHTLTQSELKKIERSTERASSPELNLSIKSQVETDNAIRKSIYRMSWYHIFSPIKSLLAQK